MTARPATNRQRKVLEFFGIWVSPKLTIGAANWEIGSLFADEGNRELWRRYVFVTGDLGTDSDALLPYDLDDLRRAQLPEGWSVTAERAKLLDELLAVEMADGSPFDAPAPDVVIEGSEFMFTGKFSFGSRTACERAVIERGGRAPAKRRPTMETDYLVVGTEGSAHWKRDAYGSKIEGAVLMRREHGAPAIISETHWRSFLVP